MNKFLIKGRYSSGAWARLLKVTDDRGKAVSDLMESLGGSLNSIYWDAENATSLAIVDLPDAMSAAAVLTAVSKTGSFSGLEAHELLTEEQLHDVIALARDSAEVYRPPGMAAVEPESVLS